MIRLLNEIPLASLSLPPVKGARPHQQAAIVPSYLLARPGSGPFGRLPNQPLGGGAGQGNGLPEGYVRPLKSAGGAGNGGGGGWVSADGQSTAVAAVMRELGLESVVSVPVTHCPDSHAFVLRHRDRCAAEAESAVHCKLHAARLAKSIAHTQYACMTYVFFRLGSQVERCVQRRLPPQQRLRARCPRLHCPHP